MTRSTRRIELAPGYLLHHRPWRDTSRILEVLTREHGRLTLFARGVRGPQAKLAPVLQPFQPLLFSFSGRGDAATLTGAERSESCAALPPATLISGFYLNELLLKLTTRHDPQPELFDHYHGTLAALRSGAPLAAALRLFEKHLLEVLGYGLNLATEAHGGRPIEPHMAYQFRPDAGLMAVAAGTQGSLSGGSLLGLARGDLSAPGALEDARRLLSVALGACLEGRTLATREVARAMVRKVAP
jgi:DNA repair protein RecO (recombination protein O)